MCLAAFNRNNCDSDDLILYLVTTHGSLALKDYREIHPVLSRKDLRDWLGQESPTQMLQGWGREGREKQAVHGTVVSAGAVAGLPLELLF